MKKAMLPVNHAFIHGQFVKNARMTKTQLELGGKNPLS
jgi:hypothetical protein